MSNYLLQTTANRSIHKGYVDTPAGQIHYWTAGKGDPLLLVHQTSSSAEEYAAMVPFLEDKYQLIAFDWPGHGNSDDPEQPYGVEEFTDSAMAVLNHLKIHRCHVLGHHGGALIAMNIAFRFPDRLAKLILSGTSGPKSKAEIKTFKDGLPQKKNNTLARDGQSILAAWIRYTEYLPDADSGQVLFPFLNNIRSRLRPKNIYDQILAWDRKPALDCLESPVLLMQGDLDPFVSRQEELLKILPPSSSRKLIQGGGAFMFFDKAKECAKVIEEFLVSLSS